MARSRFLLTLLIISCILSTGSLNSAEKATSLETIDKIIVIIYGEADIVLITTSELRKPNLDGSTRILDDLIFEALVYLDAKRFGMAATIETGERYLKMLQRSNNRTQDELRKIFEAAGYTYEDALLQLAKLSIINEMIDFRIRSRLIVPEKEVIAYYNEHPLIEPESYLVERIFIPYPTSTIKNMAAYKKILRNKLVEGTIKNIETVDFWIKKNELADDKAFIANLGEGDFSDVYDAADGFEIYKIKEIKPEKPIALEDRRLDIIKNLSQPRYEKLFGEYREELMRNATIVYYDKH